jgi:hypothetical protein
VPKLIWVDKKLCKNPINPIDVPAFPDIPLPLDLRFSVYPSVRTA